MIMKRNECMEKNADNKCIESIENNKLHIKISKKMYQVDLYV